MHAHPPLRPSWKPIDSAAVGIIYGAIMVLSILMALEETPKTPFRPAVVLFGSIFAVTLAKAFSELLAHAIHTGERILTGKALMDAWQRSHPTLTVANLPALLVLIAGLGYLDFDHAVLSAQAYCIAILIILGARVGWVINHNSWLWLGGAVFVGGIGSALALLKYAIH